MTINDLDDRDIVSGIIAKDERIFSSVVNSYYGPMFAVCSAIIGPDRADEAVQEAWISIIRNIEQFEFKSALKTWMISIASNHAKQLLRKEKKYVNLEQDHLGDLLSDRFNEKGHWQKPFIDWDQESPETMLLNQELSECITKTWKNLPENYQMIINLREIEGLGLDEICNILEITSSNVRVLLHRARNKLLSVVDHYRRTGTC